MPVVLPISTQARAALATLLGTNVTGYKIWATAPAVPVAPCLVLVPDSPWMLPERLGSGANVAMRMKILVVVDARVNVNGLDKTEVAVQKILKAVASTWSVDQVGPPQITEVGPQGSVLVTEILCTAHLKE